MRKAYPSRYQQFYSKKNWDGSVSSRFHWLFSGKISNYRIRICICLFTSSIIEEQNLIISPINNLIVLCEHNQIAIGGQNNRQNLIPWLLIYYVCRLSLNWAIPYSDNQNIFGENMLSFYGIRNVGGAAYVIHIPGYGRAGVTPGTTWSLLVPANEAWMSARKPPWCQIRRCMLG
jgi:hypothetical protein